MPGPSAQPSSLVLPPRHVTFNPVVTGLGSILGQQDDHLIDQDDPFLCSSPSAAPSHPNVSPQPQHSTRQHSPETFDLRVSPTLSDPDITPSRPQRSQNPPMDPHPPTPSRRQLRAELRALAARPAGNKRSTFATDAHSFYKLEGDRRICKFCL